MAQGHVFVHLLLLCVWWCINTKRQCVNAQNVTISKIAPIDDPEEGEIVKLRCNATNLKPGNFLEWSRLDMNTEVVIRPTLNNNKYSLYTESSSEQSVVEILRFNVLRRDDTGTYDCAVKRSEGTAVETASIYLTVRYLPSAEYPLCSPNGPFTVQEGTTQQFTCATERGSPLVSMVILKNGETVPSRLSHSGINNLFFNRSSNLNFTADDNGTFVECEILSLPFERSCIFGPITVTLPDNRETQLPTTMENSPTPHIDSTTSEVGSGTSFPPLTETTTGRSQRTPHSTKPRPDTVNPTTPTQETVNPTTPTSISGQETSTPSRQETAKPSIPSQETPNLPVTGLPVVFTAVIVGGLIFLLILLILVVYCCLKKKPKSRQPQINLPLFQPTTDLVFEPQGSHHVIRRESTNLARDDTTEKDDTPEELGADQNPKPKLRSVSHSPNTDPKDKQSAGINGTGPSPTDADKKKIETFTPQPELTPDTGDSTHGQGEVLRPHENHKSTPTTGEVVYSEVSSQQRVPQVSSAYTTYADLDLPPCTSATVPLPQDQTFYAQIGNH